MLDGIHVWVTQLKKWLLWLLDWCVGEMDVDMSNTGCNTKQLKWIFKKAIFLIESCEDKVIDDIAAKEIDGFVQKVYADSKENAYCRDIMLDVLTAINREAKPDL